MLVNTKEMFELARKGNYAIPSPDFINQSFVKDFTDVAEELKQPIILAVPEALDRIMPVEDAAAIGKYYAEKVSVPVALHIDHGATFEFLKKAIDLGFTSVMIDGSADSFEENVRKTKEVVEYAHQHNVCVEAEIGHVGSNDARKGGFNENGTSGEDDSIYTDVEDLVAFVNETNVDSIAVSIGTSHGLYKGEPKLNFERLEQLRNAVDIPLVLHGGSNTGDDNLRRCATGGISKINIFTDFCQASSKAMHAVEGNEYIKMMMASSEAVKEVMRHYYHVFNPNL